MEAVIQKALRHIEGSRSGLTGRRTVVDQAVEHEFVLADRLDRELVGVLEALLDVVGAERRELACHLDMLLPEHQDIGIRAQNHAEIAHERRHLSGRSLAIAHNVETAVFELLHARHRQELDEPLGHADRTGTGTASAVRGGEGLVEVEMHDVEAHVAGTDHAQQRVHVGAVVVEQAAAFVNERRDLLDILLEQAERVGVGHHDARDIGAEQRLKGLDVHQTVRTGLHLNYLQAANRRRSGIGAVGAVGDDHLRAGKVAAVHVVAAHDHKAGELAVGAGAGVQREVLHAGDGGESLVHLVVDLERTLHRRLVLQGVEPLEGGHGGYLLIDLGVVLHRAAAQRVEAGVNSEVHLGEVGVVARHVDLADLGKAGGLGTLQSCGDSLSGTSALGKGIGRAAFFRKFENKSVVVLHSLALLYNCDERVNFFFTSLLGHAE